MTPGTAAGVACGLAAAVLQSVAYVSSRHYTQRRADAGRPGSAASLLVRTHLWMGAMAGVTLALVWTPGVAWGQVIRPMATGVMFNLLGQAGQAVALRHAEPSRVSPLLTFKVFVPAVLSLLYGPPVGQSTYAFLSGWQWLAVVLCVAAGTSIGRGGGGMRAKAAGATAFTILMSAASDWCVALTVAGVLKAGVSPFRASLLTAAGMYLLSMLVALCALAGGFGRRPPVEHRSGTAWADWRDSLPYAASWFGAMVLLFVSFAQVGVVLGVILQCTRSFVTILIGVGLMHYGLAHIEPKQPRRVVAVRVTAGVLMSLAIALYLMRDPVAFLRR